MSDSVRPHRRQPTRLPRPWDSPGKNTGVGCHFLLQCMKVKSDSEVAQSCPALRDPMDCSLQAPPSMGFSRQEGWSGCHCLLCHLFTAAAALLSRFSRVRLCAIPQTAAYGILQAIILEWIAISFSTRIHQIVNNYDFCFFWVKFDKLGFFSKRLYIISTFPNFIDTTVVDNKMLTI